MNPGLLRLSVLYGGIVTFKSKTRFEQVPLEIVKKIAKVDHPKDIPIRKELEVTPRNGAAESLRGPSPEGLQVMNSSFDIFQVELDGSVLWQGLAASVEEARQRVKALQADTPIQYMVVSLRTGSKLLINPDGSDVPSGQQLDTARPESSQQV
jgi:hypothetical protein